jgi:hypothetical protein
MGWHGAAHQRERNGALFGVHGLVRSKQRLTLPTLSREVMFHNNHAGVLAERWDERQN